ncbi:MAG: hypothetical protein ACN4E2_02845 [Nitrospinota bacterium]
MNKITILTIIAVTSILVGCQNQLWDDYDEKDRPKVQARPDSAPETPKVVNELVEESFRTVEYDNTPMESSSKPAQPTNSTNDKELDLLFTGTINLAKGANFDKSKKWVIFVVAKDPKAKNSLAAIKIDNPTFPLNYAIKKENLMGISSVDQSMKFIIEARLDSDGDAISKDKKIDLFGQFEKEVMAGESAINILLGPMNPK